MVGYYVEGQAHISELTAIAVVAVPVLAFVVLLYSLYAVLFGAVDRVHVLLVSGTVAVIALAMVMAAAGVQVGWCLATITLAPLIVIVGFEMVGHQHQEAALARLTQASHH